jgi:hypothetical protein
VESAKRPAGGSLRSIPATPAAPATPIVSPAIRASRRAVVAPPVCFATSSPESVPR